MQQNLNDPSLKEALSHVVWLGGATDAGKTTSAKQLAERHQWQCYHYDKHNVTHHEQLAETTAVSLHFSKGSLDERWLHPEPETLVYHTLHTFEHRFPLVIQDLLAMPKETIIIAEGFGLLPNQLAPLLTQPNQAIWLIPTEEFKWASMSRRGKPSFAAQTSDPQKAKMNLFSRDILLADLIKQQVTTHGFPMIKVDGSHSIEEMTNLLEEHFIAISNQNTPFIGV